MTIQGRKVAVLAEDMYEDLELWYPVLRMREAGATVTIIGPKAQTYTSKHGYPVEATETADRADMKQFDVLIVPGGYAPDRMRRSEAMVRLVRDAFNQGKIVAAICHAGWMLASADVLRGRRATSFSSIKDDMIHAGAEWVDQPVVRDGNLITSRFPDDLPAFCSEIISALQPW